MESATDAADDAAADLAAMRASFLADAEQYWNGKDVVAELAAHSYMTRGEFAEWFGRPFRGQDVHWAGDRRSPTQGPATSSEMTCVAPRDVPQAASPHSDQHSERPQKRRNINNAFQRLVELLPPILVEYSSLQVDINLERALLTPEVHFDILPHNATEGRVLKRALDVIGALEGKFKIGITQDPAHRWSNPEYGYAHHRENGVQMTSMRILYVAADSQATAMLEASLIALCTQRFPRRCLNVKSGGDCKTTSPIHFTYVVQEF